MSIHTLAGCLCLLLPDQVIELPSGHLLTIERELAHEVKALEESVFLLTIAWAGMDDGKPGPRGYRRSGDQAKTNGPGNGPSEGEDSRLKQQYRVLRMEPLIGENRRDERTEATPGTEGTAAGPIMQAAREFEGQTVVLNQLAGMGLLHWESDRVARLDTASESYRLELEPLIPSDQ